MKKDPAGPLQVLVTGGNSRQGLAVARSLATQGVPFLILGEDPRSLAFQSRYVRHALLSPSPRSEPEAFLQFTLELIRKHQIQLILPVAESTVLIFDRHREQLEAHARLAMASSDALRAVLDKRINLRLARQLGIPCPRQFELTSPAQIPEMIEALGFPIVLKPPGSRLDPDVPTFHFKVLFAHDEAQLRKYIDSHCQGGVYPLFQECAVGEVHNFCCFAAQGDLLAVHEYHSLRRLRGVGVLRKVVQPIPEAEGYTRSLLQALKWDGVAHVAFFVNRAQQRMWYMETNGRFWSSLEGSIHAGWDFPYWVYRYFLHGKRPTPGPIAMGSRTCWHRGDLEALLQFWGGGAPPATGTNPGKLSATLQYLSGFNPSIHSDVFRRTDIRPAIADHGQIVRGLAQRLQKKFFTRNRPSTGLDNG